MEHKIVKNPLTAVDVQRLWTAFPDLLPDGRVITHDQIEAVLQEPRTSARYRRVVSKWRRQLWTERSVVLDGISARGRGYVSVTNEEMPRQGHRDGRVGLRKIKKAIAVAATPEDAALSEHTRRYRLLFVAAMEKTVRDHQRTLKDVMQALGPVKQLRQAPTTSPET